MTDEQIIHVPPSGSVAFHPTQVEKQADRKRGDHCILPM